jgi:hypothetical protein
VVVLLVMIASEVELPCCDGSFFLQGSMFRENSCNIDDRLQMDAVKHDP